MFAATNRDWIGNSNAAFATIGAVGHANEEREQYDYYATEPKAVELLLEVEKFHPHIWECACGGGHMANVLKEHGYIVAQSDLIDRGCADFTMDFLDADEGFEGDIITNPPYKYAKEFVEKAIEVVRDGGKVAMFLQLAFLTSQSRKEMFEKHPPRQYMSHPVDCFVRKTESLPKRIIAV